MIEQYLQSEPITHCVCKQKTYAGYIVIMNNIIYFIIKFFTWNTFGALTKEAKADESVAEKIPAVIRGPNIDTRLMTWPSRHKPKEPSKMECIVI